MKYVQRYVYFIRVVGQDDAPIKIGISRGPLGRMRNFAPWCPFPLELMGSKPAGMTSEALLHRCFFDLHIHHEWFRPSPLLLKTIDRILAGETIVEACAGLPLGPTIRKGSRSHMARIERPKRKRDPDKRFHAISLGSSFPAPKTKRRNASPRSSAAQQPALSEGSLT